MYIEPRPTRTAGSRLSSRQPGTRGSVFVSMLGLAVELRAAIGERRRNWRAADELVAMSDRMLADIGLQRWESLFDARSGLDRSWARLGGPAHYRRHFPALAMIAAAAVGITVAAPAARAEGEGNGDPFALHMSGEVFSVSPTRQAQAGRDAGAQTFRALPVTRDAPAALAQQTATGRFALQTRR